MKLHILSLVIIVIGIHFEVIRIHAESSVSNKDTSEAPNAGNICWNGPALQSNVTFGEDEKFNIKVSGFGCKTCKIWEDCKFKIVFRSLEKYFIRQHNLQVDLSVTIRGPALIANTLSSFSATPMHSLNRGFSVEYTPHIGGRYTVTIEGICGRLETKTNSSILVEFSLVVEDYEVDPMIPQLSPGLGHWVANNSGKAGYAFNEFSHVQKLINPREFPYKMFEKGVRLISLLGDSHMRGIFQHMEYLITGNLTTSKLFHSNSNWTFQSAEKNVTILFKFYWYNGIYLKDECDRKTAEFKMDTPLFDPNSDIVLLISGSWTLDRCRNPFEIFSKRLAMFAERMARNAAKPKAKLYWRNTPPYPSKGLHCASWWHNQGTTQWVNKLTKMVAEAYNIRYLDFWPVESTRSEETCVPHNHHYSCPAGDHKVAGVVGEATTRMLMHMLGNDDT